MYDFETLVNRKDQGSAKWRMMCENNPVLESDIAPLSVADTDLVMAPEIIEGLKEYLDTMVLGYTLTTDSYFEAVTGWFKRKHNWNVERDWIVESPGVVTALFNCIAAFTKPREGVIIMTPVYYPFRMVIENQNRRIIENQLVYKDNYYTIDFDDLEAKASNPTTKLLILCSPHNPVGRVWTKDELWRIHEICLANDILVISDEIHFDLIMPGYKHHVFATLIKEARDNSIIATAPSKTFNLAGLQTSNLVIANEAHRKTFKDYLSKTPFHALNAIGPKACELAYTQCDNWLDEFLELIETNRKLFKEFMETKIPEIKVIPLEGTYLQWFDCSGLGISDKVLNDFLTKECLLFLDPGIMFGKQGSKFQRINIACPTWVLEDALKRLEKIKKLKK